MKMTSAGKRFPASRRESEMALAREVASGSVERDLSVRDPEDRAVDREDAHQVREKMLDKTIADSFPASDPPSSDPAPEIDPFAA